MPQLSNSRDRTGRAAGAQHYPPTKSEPGVPLWGRRADGCDDSDGLRVCRSQRRSDGLRRLRGTADVVVSTAWAAGRAVVEACPLAVAVMHAPRTHRVVLRPVVMAAVVTVMAGNLEAREEDAHRDEHDAGDDHDPRRESVEPIGFDRHRRWLSGDGGRPGWVFWCFAHAQMMRGQRLGPARYNL
jgi:hypothetical protein